MKKILYLVCLSVAAICAVLSGSTQVLAVPADPRPKQFVQPDGETITVKLRGDEHFHYYLSEDDHLIINSNNAFYFASLDQTGAIKASQYMVKPLDKRSVSDREFLSGIDRIKMMSALESEAVEIGQSRAMAKGPGLFPYSTFPTKGKQKILVVVVDFPDKQFTLEDPKDYVWRMLNEPGFSEYGGTGSAYDYFLDNSLGQFDPEFDVYGPITMSEPYAYYGKNDATGSDLRPEKMIIEACEQLDETVDFKDYDRDEDGWIDNVYVIYAGLGEASGGGADTIWPHSWNIASATSIKYIFDGVRLDRYACSNEWYGNAPDGVGTFIHEFSHVMGLPDLYATSYSTAFTPDAWSVMDTGTYNNESRTPPYYSAFERYALDWLTPRQLSESCAIELKPIVDNDACIINTSKNNEYYLFENRQQIGWDKYLPGHGMLVWHIDFQSNVWDSNTVNNTATHQYVDLIEADNKQTERTRAGDAFPGTSGVTSFTDDTKPSMREWSGKALNTPITEIEEVDGVIKFNVKGGPIMVEPVHVEEATDIMPGSCNITWSSDPYATRYLVSVYTKTDDNGTRQYVDGWELADVGMERKLTITGLWPETHYYCVVNAATEYHVSDDSNEISFVTGDATLEYKRPTAMEASKIRSDRFTANWQRMDDVSGYILDVYRKGDADVVGDLCDFSNELKLPEGWTTTASVTFKSAAYCGVAVPAVRINNDGVYVETPEYSDAVYGVSFWSRGSNVSTLNSIKVLAKVGDEYVEVTELPVSNAAGGETHNVDGMPAGTTAVRIVYTEGEHKGSLALDDIYVYFDKDRVCVPVDGYDALSVGDVTSHTVTGLDGLTEYFYTVRGTDGNLLSMPSAEIKVLTGDPTGITDIEIGHSIVAADGTLMISGVAGASVVVYDIAGRMVKVSEISNEGKVSLRIPDRGIYMVRVGATTYKVKL